jgi:predicted DNA repair protein MutK
MAGGLFALLDDVAALARIAAASVDDVGAAAGRASVKAAGVVVDDTAVTPQYLHGSAAERELPIIKKIAIGSLRNKMLFILPAAVLLGQFLPGLLPVILIFGGAFLAYEGAHKVYERVTGHATEAEQEVTPTGEFTPEHERRTIAEAIRTDFILSAEIMVIALKEVVGSDEDASIWMRAIVLAVVAVLITILVYGVVAAIVKMDDVGLHLSLKKSAFSQRVGHGLVAAMPRLLAAISFVGTLAMLWVGGHIFLVSLYEIGGHDGLLDGTGLGDVLHAPYDLVHHWEADVHDAIGGALGGLAGWLLNTVVSAVVGLVVGAIVLAVLHAFGIGGGHGSEHPSEGEADHDETDEKPVDEAAAEDSPNP